MEVPQGRDLLAPFPWYALMRAEAPVVFDPVTSTWQVFRYADVQRVLSTYEEFSSRFPATGANPPVFDASLIATDPPRHRVLRTLVTQAFTPSAVEDLAPHISAIAEQLIDGVFDRGQLDAIADLAFPLPVIVIAERLGLPVENRERFKAWSDAITGATEGAGQAQGAMTAYFQQLIE